MYPIAFVFATPSRPFSQCKLFSLLRHHRLLSSTSQAEAQRQQQNPQLSSSSSTLNPVELPLCYPIYTIWGSNTGVGKTLVSAGIAASILSPTSSEAENSIKLNYIKPIQTGFPSDSDSQFVYRKVSDIFIRRKHPGTLLASNYTMKVSCSAAQEVIGSGFESKSNERVECEVADLGWYEERRLEGQGGSRELKCKTLCAWREAVSPHLAAEREKWIVDDKTLLEMVQRCLWTGSSDGSSKNVENWGIVETSGGVASPGPSGSLQSDLYRPFRLPAILVGDGRLGGISATISAYDSLKLRGYDVVAIVLEDHGLMNESSVLSYLRKSVPVIVLPAVPQDISDNLMQWYEESYNSFNLLKEVMFLAHSERVQRLQEMPRKAGDVLWWPFTQHQLVPGQTVTVIDSRFGENFSIHKIQGHSQISQQFDACASWWTQGPDCTLQIELAREMGYVAARYGHVMFPENVYEPALHCAELLLDGVGKGWASRAFFSDNGSTAVEIALKMAFRKFLVDHGIILDSLVHKKVDIKVLALKGSYHGDTLGAMEAQAPSPYTGFLQQPWYSGRGLYMDPPMIHMKDGAWKLSIPEEFHHEKCNPQELSFGSRDEVFLVDRNGSDVAQIYLSHVTKHLSPYMEGNARVGALIIEPVIHGAGGMLMIDPLFQRVLVNECRRHKIPVIFDEVFTGFWRLGVESAGQLLHCSPDIACYAKLMTGGIIPLSATLAGEDIFDAFKGESKLRALLHGHSYSAHAMGCSAAVKAIKWFKDPETNMNITSKEKSLKELWDVELVHKISCHPAVKRLVVLGTLCAVELQATGSDAGYASLYARSLVQKLREDGIYMRPLGNVIYLMCGPCTAADVCTRLLSQVYERIDQFYHRVDSAILS